MKIDLSSFDIDQIPLEENDYYEFKSGNTEKNSLGDRICKAVSGFSNTGGGVFVIGIDDKTGDADGGIAKKIGKQPLLDWVDTIIGKIEPAPKCKFLQLENVNGRGFLNVDCVILVIVIDESSIGPHMSNDSRYYIRAGRHTVPAKHFIVEAIRAKRFISKPALSYTLRLKPINSQVLQLGVIALNDNPAIDVSLTLEPLPKYLQGYEEEFPIHIPVINSSNPYFLDVGLYADCETSFGHNIILKIDYIDTLGNSYHLEKHVGVKSAPPVNIGNDELKKSIDAIARAIEKLKA